MSLETWFKNGWLRPYRTSPSQIAEHFAIADRDLEDARTDRLSTDWQFGIAYNAALKLCTILLNTEGCRPEKPRHHYFLNHRTRASSWSIIFASTSFC